MAYDENIYARIISGEISPQELKELKKSGEWNEIQKILKASEELKLPRFDKQSNYQALLDKRSAKQKIETKTFKLSSIWIGLAASLVLLLGFLFLFNDNSTLVQANFAQTESLILPDGSSIILNDGSIVEYQNRDWENNRKIHLTGEAQFQVVSGSEFEVITKNGSIQVLGTEFNVRAWSNNLYVECYTGRVSVNLPESNNILTAKQSINVVNGEVQKINKITHIQAPWIKGNLRFFQEPLDAVFDELKRQYDLEVIGPKDTRKFSGIISDNNLEDALKQICKPMNLSYTLDEKELTISKK